METFTVPCLALSPHGIFGTPVVGINKKVDRLSVSVSSLPQPALEGSLRLAAASLTAAAAGAALHRRMKQSRWRASGIARQAAKVSPNNPMAPLKVNDPEAKQKQMAKMLREEMVKATIDSSTPVPQSFTQGVNWACSAVVRAMEAGRMRMSMYFNTGVAEGDVSGELANVVSFAETLAKTLAQSPKVAENGKVRVLFNDFGSQSFVSQRWEPLGDNLVLGHLPPITMRKALSIDQEMQLNENLKEDVSLLIAVGPAQPELAAILNLLGLMDEKARVVPLILINPRLVQNSTVVRGDWLMNSRKVEASLLPVFHLEQFEPEDDKDAVPLNPAVITRVWPRPYSLWEDNPEDPESIDGYFLLDVNKEKAQNYDRTMDLLQKSRKATKLFRAEERVQREAGGKFI